MCQSYLLNYCALGNNWPTCRSCCLRQRKALYVQYVLPVSSVQIFSIQVNAQWIIIYLLFGLLFLIFTPLEQFFKGVDTFSGHYAQFSLIFYKIIYSVPDTASRNTGL